MATTQDERSLQLTTPLAKDYLLIKRLRCREGLNQLFRIEVEMLHEEEVDGFEPTAIDPKKLIGNPMIVAAIQGQTSETKIERYFHGICINFTQGSRNARFSKYRAELVPQVWMLTQVSQSRIFQNKSVPDILREVLNGFEFGVEIQGTFEPRNYCVQYRESDWDFASRMMEEEGIYYYFEHTSNNHRLILANTPASHRPCPSLSNVTFALERSEFKDTWIPAIHSWRVDNKMRTGKYELRDFNFQLPTKSLEAKHTSVFDVGGNKRLEHYDWPGGYAKRFDGIDQGGGEQPGELNKVFDDRERTVHIRQEEIDVAYRNIYGTADCCSLTAGYKFELKDHPTGENNINHVLVNVQHEAVQSPSYVSDDAVSNAYMVNFVCIPHGGGHAKFRPLRKTPKPLVLGSQTAFVVGPAGEEIFTDKYGRVKVHFHWDRSRDMDSRSSCWLRVAQIWAGNSWGSMFIPRVGMEVLVNFLEGDPDQPIIAGCVYNPENMPPYTLPDNKTRSTIKSDSSKGGGGFNEIRFEDKKGSEQIFIHAEKDLDIRVKHDRKEIVQNDRHLIVQNNQFSEGKGDSHSKLTGDKNEEIGGSASLDVKGDIDVKAAGSVAVCAGTEIHIKAGVKVIIEAPQVSLKGAGGFVDVGPAGVTIQGTMVLINSGGAAGSGSGCSTTAPTAPKEADKADAGKTVKPPQAPPPPPAKNGPDAAALESAAKKGTPFPGPAPGGSPPPAEAAKKEPELHVVGPDGKEIPRDDPRHPDFKPVTEV
ncbi:MAG: type VI secretion system tip protein TssI/VgrG [Pyrinomonadaceae bacterium]